MEKILICEESDQIQRTFKLYDKLFFEIRQLGDHLAREGVKLNRDIFIDYMGRGWLAISAELLRKSSEGNRLLAGIMQAEAVRIAKGFESYQIPISKALFTLGIPAQAIEFKGSRPHLTKEQERQIFDQFTYHLETQPQKDLYDRIQHFCDEFNAFSDFCERAGHPGLSKNVIEALTTNNKVFIGPGVVDLRSDTFILGDADKTGEQTRLKVNHRFFKR